MSFAFVSAFLTHSVRFITYEHVPNFLFRASLALILLLAEETRQIDVACEFTVRPSDHRTVILFYHHGRSVFAVFRNHDVVQTENTNGENDTFHWHVAIRNTYLVRPLILVIISPSQMNTKAKVNAFIARL